MVRHSTRPCAVCGLFYPADRAELVRDVKHLLAAAENTHVTGNILGVIVPHAGYMYSGLTAAYAFNLLRDADFRTVVVISPSHYEYFDGISVFEGDEYQTPLGAVAVNRSLREKLLRENAFVELSSRGHGQEHAVEVELPFLQCVKPEFTFLPIVMGDQKAEYCFTLGDALGTMLRGENALILASSDLSHYYPSDIARKIDAVVMDDVQRFDENQLMTDLETGRAEACGGGPMVAALRALRHLGAHHIEVLHQCNSGDITGDHSRVVGYLSAVAVG
jgi:AmmeMemoRadiSam system protein B